MNKLSGIPTLNAGAPDLRLSGDQTQRGSYVQRRRAQMAYGGIPGADGRRAYGIGSIFQKYIKDPIEMLITGKNPTQIENESQARVDREENIVRDIPADFDPTTDRLADITPTDPGTGPYTPWYEQMFKGSPTDPNDPLSFDVGDIFGMGKEQYGKYTIPMTIGATMGKLQQDYLDKQPPFPADETGITFQTAQEAMADPTLRFKPEAQYANVAEGGRIGYQTGERVGPSETEKGLLALIRKLLLQKQGERVGPEIRWGEVMPPRDFPGDEGILAPKRDFPGDPGIYKDPGDWKERLRKRFLPEEEMTMAAQGGRIGAQEGGLMDLGGMEKDYRQEGGFVPIGGREKADDVPARLSKNEFVFTADAVRSAGGGDIDAGAEVMERLMENLEAGGKVSEESQGLEGAQEMFANTQRLQNRII